MRIGIDGLPLTMSRNHGIGNYAVNLIRSVLKADRDNEYYILYADEESRIGCDAPNLHESIVGAGRNEALPAGVMDCIYEFAAKNGIDAFYTPNAANFEIPMFDRAAFGDTKLAGTIHDIIPWIFKEQYLPDCAKRETIRRYYDNLSSFDLIFADSESTKKDVQRYFDCDNIVTLPLGANIVISDTAETEAAWKLLRSRLELKPPFFLAVLGMGYNKNLHSVLKAYALACEKEPKMPPIVFTGRLTDTQKADIAFFLKGKPGGKCAVFPGFVTDQELEALYGHASWCIFPTMYEGFGMPVIEAWLHGKPVLTSDNSSLDEIAGGASVQVNPFSVDSIKDGLLTISRLTEPERQRYAELGEMRARDFSWEKTAEQFLHQIRKCKDEKI